MKREDLFWPKVARPVGDGCWLWTASLTESGYGRFWDGKATVRAHRFSYELLVGPIPEGLQIDHLCRVKACVNPRHLEAVTGRVNTLRAEDGPAAINAAKTHCPQGHPYSPENTRYNSKGRLCRACGIAFLRRRRREGRVAS